MKKILAFLLIGFSLVSLQANAATETVNSTETASQYTKSTALTAKVKAKLASLHGVNSNDISVTTETTANNTLTVILTGQAKSKSQIKSIVKAIKHLKGVDKVDNKLEVASDKN